MRLKDLAGLGALAVLVLLVALAGMEAAVAEPSQWKREWKKTNFKIHSVDYASIKSGGPPKDGIPPIDDPEFVDMTEVENIADTEPVIGLIVNGEARAYPLYVMIWHEIVNDTIGGVPVAVTFCPLCNAAMVFDRRVGGRTLDFGTTGKLRNSDLVMYDRQTESWWQQFLGEAIVGSMTGKRLKMLPSRLESFARFKARVETGKVLVPNSTLLRRYGVNPYVNYDSSSRPFLYDGPLPTVVAPLSRVVSLGKRGAWSFGLLRRVREVRLEDGIVIRWEAGQNSALDTAIIAEGVDVGNVIVQRMKDGTLEDVVHSVDFAFAYRAFYPDAPIHVEWPKAPG